MPLQEVARDRVHALSPRRLPRFLIVGAAATLSAFALTLLLVEAGVAPFVAATGSYALVFVAAFAAQRSWTFEASGPARRSFPRYLAAQAASATVAGTAAFAAAELGLPSLAIAGGAALLSGGTSFVLSALWVFAD